MLAFVYVQVYTSNNQLNLKYLFYFIANPIPSTLVLNKIYIVAA